MNYPEVQSRVFERLISFLVFSGRSRDQFNFVCHITPTRAFNEASQTKIVSRVLAPSEQPGEIAPYETNKEQFLKQNHCGMATEGEIVNECYGCSRY